MINPDSTSSLTAARDQAKAHDSDVVIAGGGMAGSMLAVALAKQCPTLSIAIVEQQAHTVSQASFDSRSIALAAGSVQFLQQLGIWSALSTHGCPILDIAVSDRGHFGKTWLSAAEYRVPALGQVIEVEHLGAVLAQALASCPQVTRFQPNQIVAVQTHIDRQLVSLQDGQQVSTRLLVVAEGAQSATRQLAGIEQETVPYQQSAIITNLALAQPHQHRAFERFTEHGPIALLPLVANRYSLVWTVAPEQVAPLLALSDSQFVAQLQQAFGYRAGCFTGCGQRLAYPLARRQSPQVVSHRLALLGNSLHSLHPIAGQGFNLALRDIACLSQLLAASTAAEVGTYPQLRQYQVSRQADMQRVIQLTDGLVRTFSNRSRLIAFARNAGLLTLVLSDAAKRPLAKQTMGFGTS